MLLQGGRRYAPFVIANGGNLGESLQGSIQAFLTKNPDNVAATLVGLRHFRAAKKAQTITGQRVNLDL